VASRSLAEVRMGLAGALMSYRETEHLRVLIASERKDRLTLLAPIVVALGHDVIAREIDVNDVGARDRPRASRCCACRTRREPGARARADREDRARKQPAR